jgi:hypothetical protein
VKSGLLTKSVFSSYSEAMFIRFKFTLDVHLTVLSASIDSCIDKLILVQLLVQYKSSFLFKLFLHQVVSITTSAIVMPRPLMTRVNELYSDLYVNQTSSHISSLFVVAVVSAICAETWRTAFSSDTFRAFSSVRGSPNLPALFHEVDDQSPPSIESVLIKEWPLIASAWERVSSPPYILEKLCATSIRPICLFLDVEFSFVGCWDQKLGCSGKTTSPFICLWSSVWLESQTELIELLTPL